MNAYKKYVIFVLAIPLPLIALLTINLYLYDPAQIFHKPYLRKPTFFSDMRVAARGIIQHYNFDSYILGTSMLENTSAKEVKEKLGGEWVNISMSGSTFRERATAMRYLFGIKQPKQILYSLDYLTGVNEKNRDNMPIKLYNDSNLDDFSFYLNDRFVLCSLIWSKKKHCVGDSKAKIEDSLVSWIDWQDMKGRFGGFENWVKFKNNEQIKGAFKVMSQYEKTESHLGTAKDLNMQIQENIIKNILSFVEQNKTTKFYFIVPTYSRLNYKINHHFGGSFLQFHSTLLWLVSEIEKYPNATLYGFDDIDYADKIANYKDLTHYNIDMNSMQLDAIRDNTHRLTSENIEEYLKIMKQKIQEYDVEPLVKIAKEALGEK